LKKKEEKGHQGKKRRVKKDLAGGETVLISCGSLETTRQHRDLKAAGDLGAKTEARGPRILKKRVKKKNGQFRKGVVGVPWSRKAAFSKRRIEATILKQR